jgi:hypothetical protein
MAAGGAPRPAASAKPHLLRTTMPPHHPRAAHRHTYLALPRLGGETNGPGTASAALALPGGTL